MNGSSAKAPLIRLLRATVLSIPLTVIWIWQHAISPLWIPRCRFWPSCSEYAKEALIRHGIVFGSWLSLRRLCRCHPWCEGGVDEVPDCRKRKHDSSEPSTISSK